MLKPVVMLAYSDVCPLMNLKSARVYCLEQHDIKLPENAHACCVSILATEDSSFAFVNV